MKKAIGVILSAMMVGCTVTEDDPQTTNESPAAAEREQEEPKEIIHVLTEVEFAHTFTPEFMLENKTSAES